MTVALKLDKEWTADEFVTTDQYEFGPLWRYELVDGRVIGHAAPSPDHAAIIAGLSMCLGRLLAGRPNGCRPEVGSAATSRSEQRITARIPDVTIRCGDHPVVFFEVVSPSEIRDWRGRDRKRQHLQAVHGVREIFELFQDDYAVHAYRSAAEPDPGGAQTWTFEAIGGPDSVLRIDILGLELPLAEIYAFADVPEQDGQDLSNASE
jgi:Uma2 family endonuclease